MFSRLKGKLSSGVQSTMSMKTAQLWTAAIFTLLLVGGSLAISGSISGVVQMATLGIDRGGPDQPLGVSLGGRARRTRHDLSPLQARPCQRLDKDKGGGPTGGVAR